VLDLEFTAEQEMLRSAVRDLLEDHCGADVVRQMEDDPDGFPPELWRRLAEMDMVGLLIPERSGGSGMSLLEGVVLYEELGRALAPVPHFVSGVMAAGALNLAGSEAQQDEWLPGIASGERIVTTAWIEPESGFGPAGVQLSAEADGSDFVLRGTKWHVPFAKAAQAMVVLARTGAGRGPEGVDLFLVPTDAPGVGLTQQLTIASDTQYQVTFDGVRVPATARLGAAPGWATWDTLMHDGIVLLAAQAIGGARRALELTTQYAKDRRQFDKPLGAFQAIGHYLADAVTRVDGGEQLVHEAAWARANGRPVDRLAPMAKLYACQTYRDLTAMAQQVFGGIGFTLEFDIQLYFRRAKALQLSWWDGRYLEELVASAVLEGVPA
jgi:alkylation response protein AidB-like acyl-CoA dehydrogenase